MCLLCSTTDLHKSIVNEYMMSLSYLISCTRSKLFLRLLNTSIPFLDYFELAVLNVAISHHQSGTKSEFWANLRIRQSNQTGADPEIGHGGGLNFGQFFSHRNHKIVPKQSTKKRNKLYTTSPKLTIFWKSCQKRGKSCIFCAPLAKCYSFASLRRMRKKILLF